MVKHRVALTGSYVGSNIEKLFKGLSREGILQMSLIGREITLQVRSENLEGIKKSLKKLGVDNLTILELKKAGMTVSNAGRGVDGDEILSVSLIPSALDEGIKSLAVLHEHRIGDETIGKMNKKVGEILNNAGITDAIYTIQIKKDVSEEAYMDAIEIATLNALFEAGGVVNIE